MHEMERLQHELHAKLPAFQRRLDRTKQLVEDALKEMHNGYIAFSTGKDSLVVADIVWSINPSIPAVYFDADCAFPESTELLERYAKHRTIIKWKTEPLLDTFERLGGPAASGIERATMESTVWTPIKTLLEHYHFDGCFLGLRADESEGRKKTAQVHGLKYRYKRDGVLRSLPVAYWSYADIWAHIVSQNIDYNRAYDRMWDMSEEDRRISYWAGETKIRHGRWVFLKREYPELFNRFAARFPEVRSYI